MAQSPVCKNLNAVWYALSPLMVDDDLIDFWSDPTSNPSRKMERLLGTLDKLIERSGCQHPIDKVGSKFDREVFRGHRDSRTEE